jgi:hypothetical protein
MAKRAASHGVTLTAMETGEAAGDGDIVPDVARNTRRKNAARMDLSCLTSTNVPRAPDSAGDAGWLYLAHVVVRAACYNASCAYFGGQNVHIPILVEPVAGNGYRAVSAAPLAFTVEGATREIALAKLREKLDGRMSGGAEVVSFEIVNGPHPLAEFAGMFKDDLYFDEVVEIMSENRRKMDADTNVP